MIIEAKISYGVVGRLKGRRNSDSYAMTEMVPVEVREISASEASIAYWWHATALQGTYRGLEPIRGQLAVRSFEGELYQPLVSRVPELPGVNADPLFMKSTKTGLAQARMIDAATLQDATARGLLVHAAGNASINLPNRANDTAINLIAKVESSTRDSNLARFSEHYGKLVLIDGILHARTVSPIIEMEIGRTSWRQFRIRDRGWVDASPQHVYCITRFEDAKKIFRNNSEVYDRVEWREIKPDIVDTSLISFDETAFVVGMASQKLLKVMAGGSTGSARRPYLSTEPIETMVAWGELRDASADGNTAEIYGKLLVLEELVRGQGLYHREAQDVLALKERLEADGMAPAPAPEFRP